ncbi:hypothetical protein Efla_002874 [Eimeria flavescens]
MSEVEQRYPIYDQELLALVRALERQRRLLLHAESDSYTDHKGLQYLLQVEGDKPARMLLSLTESRQVETPQERYHKPTTLQQQAGETKTYVQSCPRFRQAKHVPAKLQGSLHSFRIHNRRWATASSNFIMGLPKTARGKDAILTIVHSLSKMADIVPTQTTVTAEGLFELLADFLIPYHGLPEKFIQCRHPGFVADLWGMLCKQFQINRALSSAWYPQTDWQCYLVHRTLEQVLRTYIQSDEAAWEDLLPVVELAYSCTTHTSTGLSPFEGMIGGIPLRASDLDIVDAYEPTDVKRSLRSSTSSDVGSGSLRPAAVRALCPGSRIRD